VSPNYSEKGRSSQYFLDNFYVIIFLLASYNILFMQVQFEKPRCLKHRLPLTYLCNNHDCKCGVYLCLKCAQDHANKKDIDDEFLKEAVFSKKIEIETEIVGKQYEHLEKY
jgi:hypothetical protein